MSSNKEKTVRIEINQFEDDIIKEILDSEKIDYCIQTRADSAYGPLFQITEGYGYVEVKEEDKEKVDKILLQIRNRIEYLED